ncbi:2-C-methyl-D-erythritol 4-phosphate cytidylyltransferase [Leptospira kobayashii]|uniref:2-C-methyl-D-erythritol 4-phosphate cytidylyltransferase n=1 Tax=Leptospira kobayashii TaxID=1917830 RepID=A0ABM7UIJ2_9LEPT|nr:IspD/TarI family cytidylyltransferase [Leptospira kobayashii]BDA78457.1 2-C-methyl-D-erythritol 4-phosphate cytidylyltransferase [Leptospira kobayashii]
MRNLYAIILAGGVGTRIGGDTPKQFIRLAGKPLFLHSIEVFRSWGLLKSLTLVSHKDWILKLEKEADPVLEANDRIVEGGASRHLSCLAGISSIPYDDEDIILIHDAARPFFTTSELDELVGSAQIFGASTLATAATETIVRVEENSNFTKESVPRSLLYMVKTPQAVTGKLLKELLANPVSEDISLHPTDLCSWVETLGKQTGIVPCSSKNIKITTPTDVILATELLKS